MYARLRLVLLVVMALFLPSPGSAQQANVQSVSAAGPRLDATVTGIQIPSQDASNPLNLQRRRQDVGKPVALMIVGGAAIVLGAVIGDDVGLLFMIGGAVALLIGLYRYLQ